MGPQFTSEGAARASQGDRIGVNFNKRYRTTTALGDIAAERGRDATGLIQCKGTSRSTRVVDQPRSQQAANGDTHTIHIPYSPGVDGDGGLSDLTEISQSQGIGKRPVPDGDIPGDSDHTARLRKHQRPAIDGGHPGVGIRQRTAEG